MSEIIDTLSSPDRLRTLEVGVRRMAQSWWQEPFCKARQNKEAKDYSYIPLTDSNH